MRAPGVCSRMPARDTTLPDPVTDDAILGGQLSILQPKNGFRVAIDTVLLAASVPAQPGQTVFEPGAGIGAAALCLAKRVDGARVHGLELQADLVRLAGDNARRNGLGAAVDIMQGDIASPPLRIAAGTYDHVMMNPPYLAPDAAAPSPVAPIARATVEGAAGLVDWVEQATRMAKRDGTISLVHRADRLDDALAAFAGRAGGLQVFPLWAGPDKPAGRVLIRGIKGSAAPLVLHRGLILHGADGSYTVAADAALRGAALEF